MTVWWPPYDSSMTSLWPFSNLPTTIKWPPYDRSMTSLRPGNSFINNRKSSGPNTLPCGTPLSTSSICEKVPLQSSLFLTWENSPVIVTVFHWSQKSLASQVAVGVEQCQMLPCSWDILRLVQIPRQVLWFNSPMTSHDTSKAWSSTIETMSFYTKQFFWFQEPTSTALAAGHDRQYL